MKTLIIVLVAVLLGPVGVLAQSKEKGKHKIVIQFNEADSVSQSRVVLQVENIRKIWADAQVEVVCLGGGLDLLTTKGSKFSTMIAEWTNKGIVFAACNNSMNLRKISKEDMLPQAVIIPAAVIELAVKQEEGWSYFRGGK